MCVCSKEHWIHSALYDDVYSLLYVCVYVLRNIGYIQLCMMISTLCGMCVCVLRNIEHIHVCIMSTLSGMCVLQHAICTFFQKMCRRTRCGGKKDLKTKSWKEGLEDYTTHLFSI